MRTNNREDLEYKPLPWPVKKGVLALLGLGENATQAEYIAAWNAAMTTANGGKKEALQKRDDARIQFAALVKRLQTQNGMSYDRAFEAAKTSPEGKQLIADAEKFSRQAAQPDMMQDTTADTAFAATQIGSVDARMEDQMARNQREGLPIASPANQQEAPMATANVSSHTADQARSAFNDVVRKIMREEKCDYDTAFHRASTTANSKALLDRADVASTHKRRNAYRVPDASGRKD